MGLLKDGQRFLLQTLGSLATGAAHGKGRVRQKLLELVDRERRAVHDVVVDIDLLYRSVREGNAEDQGTGPPVPGEECKQATVQNHEQDLEHEDGLGAKKAPATLLSQTNIRTHHATSSKT